MKKLGFAILLLTALTFNTGFADTIFIKQPDGTVIPQGEPIPAEKFQEKVGEKKDLISQIDATIIREEEILASLHTQRDVAQRELNAMIAAQ